MLEFLNRNSRVVFTVYETYSYSVEPPLDCRISAFGGEDDPRVSVEELKLWGQQTAGGFSLRSFPGDHFFIRSAWNAVLASINEDLESSLDRWPNS